MTAPPDSLHRPARDAAAERRTGDRRARALSAAALGRHDHAADHGGDRDRDHDRGHEHEHEHEHDHDHDAAGDGHAGHAQAGLHHGHAHGPVEPADFNRAFAVGIVLNLVFVAVEAFYGWKVDSLALLADAGHNLSDVAGLAVAWAGALAAGMRPDARYTYGRKRASILAAFANAVLLLVAMGSLAWEALGRLRVPQAPADGVTLMVVAGLGIVVNLGTALLFLRGRHGDLNVRGAFLHMASDALVSAGVVATGALALVYGWPWLDPAVSLVIALVIVLGTWSLFRQSLHLLFDGVPEGIDLHAVRRELEALPGVVRVHDLHVWATGTTETALTAHLVMPRGNAGDRFLEDATRRLQARFRIGHVTLQVVREPFMALCADATEPAQAGRRAGAANESDATGSTPP
jgi:cobalt-zinc-cadmium efflux system protein